MTKAQSSRSSKVRIAAAGAFVGIVASLMSGTAAQALPNEGGFGCTSQPQLCDGGIIVDPPLPPEPPKCQVIICDGDDLPVFEPVDEPAPQPEPEPEPEPQPEPQPEPTHQPEEPKHEEPKHEEPTTNDTPAPTGQNVDNGQNQAPAKVITVVRTRTVTKSAPVQQVEAAPAEVEEAQEVQASDQIQNVARTEATEGETGLSSFAKRTIIFTLLGAAYGLFTYMKQRKNA